MAIKKLTEDQKENGLNDAGKRYVEPQFTPFEAVGICEGFQPCDSEETEIAAWQYLIDKGICWKLQGFFGRTAKELIQAGICRAAVQS